LDLCQHSHQPPFFPCAAIQEPWFTLPSNSPHCYVFKAQTKAEKTSWTPKHRNPHAGTVYSLMYPWFPPITDVLVGCLMDCSQTEAAGLGAQ
jgi:hypothetical protein